MQILRKLTLWKFIRDSGFTKIVSKDNGAVPLPLNFLTKCKDTFPHADVARSTTLKADSRIACRAHAAPTPFPFNAVPLRVYNVSFPFDLRSAAVSDSYMPCHAHAMLRPCRSSQGHSIARAVL